MTRIAIFASGSGSNAENIIRYFSDNESVKVVLVLSNNSSSGVLIRAKMHNIPTFIFTKNDLNQCSKVLDTLKYFNASMIVLAGFLLKIPLYMIQAYPNSILNIHPSLLPKYKGLNTHKRVISNKELYSGCTVHYVNSKLDSGKIIIQKKVKIRKNDTPNSLSKRILIQEHKLYPKAILKIFNL